MLHKAIQKMKVARFYGPRCTSGVERNNNVLDVNLASSRRPPRKSSALFTVLEMHVIVLTFLAHRI